MVEATEVVALAAAAEVAALAEEARVEAALVEAHPRKGRPILASEPALPAPADRFPASAKTR